MSHFHLPGTFLDVVACCRSLGSIGLEPSLAWSKGFAVKPLGFGCVGSHSIFRCCLCYLAFRNIPASSKVLLPSPFFSGENTRPRGLTISHNDIYFQERRFSARTATILVFLSSGRNTYHMEDPGICISAYIYIYYIYSDIFICKSR